MLLTFLVSMLPIGKAAAQEAYAEYDNNGTLTFYYDTARNSREGTTYDLNDDSYIEGFGYAKPGWVEDGGPRVNVTTVVFDPSFAKARPVSTCAWFSGMNSLTSIDGLTYLNTSEVTIMQSMFSGCEKLTTLDLSSFDTRKVTDMYSMFNRCKKLTNLDLSSFDTRKVTDMMFMFAVCSSLETLDVSSFDTRNVTYMRGMFQSCSSLETLDLCSFDTRNLQYPHLMFFNCINLRTILVSHRWTTENVIDDGVCTMFDGCASLVGGEGTVWDSDRTYYTYARIDGGSSNPGYLTQGPEAYVEYDNNGTLTFYYDTYFDTRYNPTYWLNSDDISQDWWDQEENICPDVRRVVFDYSFADARPYSSQGWFAYFTNLEEIVDMDKYLNTSRVTDMSGMFMLCKSLTSVDLSNFDTRKVKDMGAMFSLAEQLKTISVGRGWSTEAVTNSHNMFLGCTSIVGEAGTVYDVNHIDGTYAHIDGGPNNPGYLTLKLEAYAEFDNNSTLTFYYDDLRGERTGMTYELNGGEYDPDWVADGTATIVTRVVFDDSFKKARPISTCAWFSTMENIETIEGMAENLNTSEVKYMSAMFYFCLKLKNIDLSSFDTQKVKSMYSMFFNCTDLTSLDLSTFDTRNVTDMSAMFSNCKLQKLDLSSFDTRKVENMALLFQGNTDLTTIFVGDNWSTAAVTMSDRMFLNCTSLVGGAGTVYDENNVDGAYAHIDGGPGNPGYLSLKPTPVAYAEYVQNPGTTDKTDSGVSGTLTFYYDTNRSQHTGTVYDLNDTYETPGWHTDNNYRDVTSVVFDSSFADARPITGYRWFQGMTSLESITGMKEYLNTSEMTKMSGMFEHCIGLDSLDLSSFDTHNVTDMVDMFSNCYCLKYLDVSSFDTRNVNDMKRMFYLCQRLEWLNVGSFDTQNVWFMDDMFFQCMSLTNLDLTGFNTSNVTNMGNMFNYCSGLVKIYVGDGWNVDNVGDTFNMFYGCNNILGMLGTTYDGDHVDGTYAHIDGGPDNPGYLSRIVPGDVNLDGTVGIGDIVAITNVMAGIEKNKGVVVRANVNGDESVGIGDIVAITNIMAGKE